MIDAIHFTEYWGQVSKEAKSLISSLLTVKPTKRLSADAAMKNEWIAKDDKTLLSQDLGVNLDQFKKFNAKRKLRAAVKAVILTQKMNSLGLNFKNHL